MKKPPDKRLHAYRPDRADIALKGVVSADDYVAGSPAQVVASVIDMKNQPTAQSEAGSQLLLGETVAVFEDAGGWSCGMVAGLIHDVPTCQELMDRIMGEAEEIIAKRLQTFRAA